MDKRIGRLSAYNVSDRIIHTSIVPPIQWGVKEDTGYMEFNDFSSSKEHVGVFPEFRK